MLINLMKTKLMLHWKLIGSETLMLYMVIAMLYDGDRRELLFAVRMIKWVYHFPLHPHPVEIKKVLWYDTEWEIVFLLASASIGCNEQAQQGFNSAFRIQGKLYHRLCNLLPPVGSDPKFAQTFFSWFGHRAHRQTEIIWYVRWEILRDIQDYLHNSNSYIQSFKSTTEICAEEEDLQIVLHANKVPTKNGQTRTYNLPTSSEVAMLLPVDLSGNSDIILRCRSGAGQQ